MRPTANFEVVESTDAALVIRDVGPHDRFLTVTNDVEAVVELLANQLRGRQLFYYDSFGALDEIVVVDGKFAGFKPGALQ